MSNWITGKDLAAYWDLKAFEFFGLLKKGLQPYDGLGRKVIDADTLEKGKKYSFEWLVEDFTAKRNANVSRGPMTDTEINSRAKMAYARQPVVFLSPPENNPYMSFTLPSSKKKAHTAIQKAMGLLFNKDEASDFAEEHGYRAIKEQNGGEASGLCQSSPDAAGVPYQPWVTGEWIKRTLPTDNSGLLSLVYEGVLTAHTEILEPLTPEDIHYLMKDPVGHLSSAWPMAGFDGLKFRKAEVLRVIEAQRCDGAAEGESNHAAKSKSLDSKADVRAEDTKTIRREKYPNIVAEIKTGQNIEWRDLRITF
jgi:hypothetical protein